MDILNLEELITDDVSDELKERLIELLEELKENHYPNTLTKIYGIYEMDEVNTELTGNLKMIEAICHTQIGEAKRASEIIRDLYDDDPDLDMLMQLGELAYMCDYKLARRIMSAAVKQLDGKEIDRIRIARCYLILGETEEKLDKLTRSIKYFKTGLNYFEDADERDRHMISYLHFKIGMLFSAQNKEEASVEYLNKVIDMAGDNDPDMKIRSLVSIAKTYGNMEKSDKVLPYLEEALELLPGSNLENSLAHAEALTDMAFYYFNESKLTDAVPYYKHAIQMYSKLDYVSHRQIGMIYMQYAYCLEHKRDENISQAAVNYEKAIERLEKAKDRQLLENALADVIAFFNAHHYEKKKRYYEDKFVKMNNSHS
ncbi:tetratricopeptide repeat protein [Virgibacillus ihumii]|uniref:tetratricopeptide repeat protein n=1 Tax=Virgibacillus ihumii TaxID=2686091 RepID=UPI00157C5071|nr:hypothetical protein [Virgibacillus ihumii]